MKFRSDFVTNSSSSSFICYGVTLDEIKNMDKVYKATFQNYVENTKGKSWFAFTDEELEELDDEDKIDYVKNELGLYEAFEDNILTVGGYDNDIIGITLPTFLSEFPDEKFGDAKKIVARELNKQFDENFTEEDIELHEQAWYS